MFLLWPYMLLLTDKEKEKEASGGLCVCVCLCLVPLFLLGFISSLPKLAWVKRLCCCCTNCEAILGLTSWNSLLFCGSLCVQLSTRRGGSSEIYYSNLMILIHFSFYWTLNTLELMMRKDKIYVRNENRQDLGLIFL
jgi:hypothetical protein